MPRTSAFPRPWPRGLSPSRCAPSLVGHACSPLCPYEHHVHHVLLRLCRPLMTPLPARHDILSMQTPSSVACTIRQCA